jgi:hypothetical protein
MNLRSYKSENQVYTEFGECESKSVSFTITNQQAPNVITCYLPNQHKTENHTFPSSPSFAHKSSIVNKKKKIRLVSMYMSISKKKIFTHLHLSVASRMLDELKNLGRRTS